MKSSKRSRRGARRKHEQKLEERERKNRAYEQDFPNKDKVPLTEQIAKKVTLELWRYLAAHGELPSKEFLPVKMFKKIAHYKCRCPLCALYMSSCCVECPLIILTASGKPRRCVCSGHPYNKWAYADTDDERVTAAGEIVKLLEAWEV